MPVHITDPDALNRIMQVECTEMDERQKGRFRADQLTEDMYSFAGFKSAYAALTSEERSAYPSDTIAVDGNRAIYGNGGWHRYFVRRGTGEIVFSTSHSLPEYQELARQAGFTIA